MCDNEQQIDITLDLDWYNIGFFVFLYYNAVADYQWRLVLSASKFDILAVLNNVTISQ